MEGRAASDGREHQNVSPSELQRAGMRAAPPSGGTSAPADVVREAGGGWVGSGGE